VKAPTNTFCYTFLKAVIKSIVEQEIIKTLQKEVLQCVKKLAEYNFIADFRKTKFGGDYDAWQLAGLDSTVDPTGIERYITRIKYVYWED